MTADDKPASPSRRRWLKRLGWTAAGLTVVAAGGIPVARANMPVLPSFGDPEPGDGLSWVQLMPDGRIHFFCPRMEMGQGASLGLAQVVAEELDLTQDQIDCHLPDTGQIAQVKMTVGSESIFAFWEPVAASAAHLRELLRRRAAEESGVAVSALTDANGGFQLPDGSKVNYAELAGQEPTVVELALDDRPELRSAASGGPMRSIGQSWAHQDLTAIVTGQIDYGRDVEVPDMAFGAAAHPPGLAASLRSVDATAALNLPFVLGVVEDRPNGFVGVVTEQAHQLPKALDALNLEWEVPSTASQDDIAARFDVDSYDWDNERSHLVQEAGDAARSGLGAARVNARYDTVFLAHSPMEPRAAVVHVQADQTEVWCGTQDAYFVRGRVAKITGQDPEQVTVHPHRMGGGFGGRIQCQPSEEAARLSMAVGRPVKVQWSRERELSGNYFQPIFSHRIKASVDGAGTLQGWSHDYVTSPIMLGPMREMLGQSRLVNGAIGMMDRFVADMGSTRGATTRYKVPNQRIRFASVRSEVPTSAWRGLGSAPNAFAIECAIDELAHEAGIDPLEFRLRNLDDHDGRLAPVLRKVAELSGWPERGEEDRGFGLAAAVYKDQTPVAVVAEVVIDRQWDMIRVRRIWCAHDCGRIVNPDQVCNLIEGNIVWGCSLALKEQTTVENGAIAEQNFDLYDPLRHWEAPEIEIALIEPSGVPPLGVGESALPPVAPAIANAVFAATGTRLRRLPLSFDALAGGD
jgi:CO/xanthine dehydrogenase Mo-binding subunit